MRNEPVVVDVGELCMDDVERVRLNYNNSRRENPQEIMFDSNNKDISNGVEEGEEQDVDDLRNILADVDIGENYVENIEQMHSSYHSGVEIQQETTIEMMTESNNGQNANL